jgi:hypothetical protein
MAIAGQPRRIKNLPGILDVGHIEETRCTEHSRSFRRSPPSKKLAFYDIPNQRRASELHEASPMY